MACQETKFADITFSPDDEAETGKGWYATTIKPDGSEDLSSGLYLTRAEAVAWARKHGANRFLEG